MLAFIFLFMFLCFVVYIFSLMYKSELSCDILNDMLFENRNSWLDDFFLSTYKVRVRVFSRGERKRYTVQSTMMWVFPYETHYETETLKGANELAQRYVDRVRTHLSKTCGAKTASVLRAKEGNKRWW